jgi:hypothetical protein
LRLDRLAPRRRALVGRAPGVALDHVDLRDVDVQLVGGDLRLRGREPGAELDLPDEDRHAAVLADRDPRVDQLVVDDRAGGDGAAGGRRAQPERQAERDDEGAASLEEVDAGELFLECCRHRSSYLIAFAPRWTASRIR